MIIESMVALGVIKVGHRLLCGPEPKSLPVENKDQEMFGLLGGGNKNQVAQVPVTHEGLWAFQNNIHGSAIANGHKVEVDLRGFDNSNRPFMMTSKFN